MHFAQPARLLGGAHQVTRRQCLAPPSVQHTGAQQTVPRETAPQEDGQCQAPCVKCQELYQEFWSCFLSKDTTSLPGGKQWGTRPWDLATMQRKQVVASHVRCHAHSKKPISGPGGFGHLLWEQELPTRFPWHLAPKDFHRKSRNHPTNPAWEGGMGTTGSGSSCLPGKWPHFM